MSVDGAVPNETSILAAMLTNEPGRLLPLIDLDLVRAADRHDVAPLVYHRFHQSEGWNQVPEAARRALSSIAREAAAVDAVRCEHDRQVIRALVAAGLSPLVFKGAAVGCRCYPASSLRPRIDTDLLLREDEAERAAGVLERLGLTRMPRPTGRHVTHQFVYSGTAAGIEPNYDVHWKIADPHVFADVLTYEELAREAVPLPQLGDAARAIGDVHALIIACTHRVAHHFDSESLIRVYDIALLAGRMDPAAWERVIALATDRRVCAVCARGLTLAAATFGAPVPPWVLEALDATGEPTAAYLRPELRRVDILRSDLRALGWGARARLLREHLLPSPAYVLASYGTGRRVLLPLLYVHRILRGVWAWFRPLAAAAGSPETTSSAARRPQPN